MACSLTIRELPAWKNKRANRLHRECCRNLKAGLDLASRLAIRGIRRIRRKKGAREASVLAPYFSTRHQPAGLTAICLWPLIRKRRRIGGPTGATSSLATFPEWSSTRRRRAIRRRLRKDSPLLAPWAALDLTLGAESQAILASGALPQSAGRDAAHVAVAAFHAVDYLLTWNCKHLANAQIMRKIESVCQTLGYRMPILCTPEELMGG